MRTLSLLLLLAVVILTTTTGRAVHYGIAQTSPPVATAPPMQPAKELTLDLGDKAALKLMLIPAGKFLMGSPETENNRNKDETQHEVTISKPFYMGITPVTVDQFAAFVTDSGYKTEAEKDGGAGFQIKDGKIEFKETDSCSWRNPSFDQKGDHPVVQVSWNDAQAFCDWLSKKSGKTVVLPTEAQWEYSCRAGTKTVYPWGDNPDDGKGWENCSDQSLEKEIPNQKRWAFFSWEDGFVFTSPVGRFKANAFGLYDMNGNAWQWCQDRYGNYEKGAATDPTGPATGDRGVVPDAATGDPGVLPGAADHRVMRGGSWGSGPRVCRAALRLRHGPIDRDFYVGFRVVVVAGPD